MWRKEPYPQCSLVLYLAYFNRVKLSVVVKFEKLLFPGLRKELLYSVQPDFNSLIDRHRLRHPRPVDTRLTVGGSVHEVFVLGQKEQLFLV